MGESAGVKTAGRTRLGGSSGATRDRVGAAAQAEKTGGRGRPWVLRRAGGLAVGVVVALGGRCSGRVKASRGPRPNPGAHRAELSPCGARDRW
ncbi:hypothetical protein NDU88_002415 [Pleurodeles waltl]|uniref:Uncharacterized protein n=1 Tax=Pleurodeles waltl TaxID=8319 RepID=A0AAV7MNS5_PLEWA|nr:hypothetical protein NDU88_002415 [Pleurodeles waltl]